MKIGIMGAGAVGAFFGSVLHKAGHEVTFIARGQHLKAMRENGLTVKSDQEIMKVEGIFSGDPASLSDSDIVLICVKSNDTEETAKNLKNVLREDTYILTLQNGVDNEEILADIFGKNRVFSCATYVQAAVQEPGVIQQNGEFSLVVGELESSALESAQEIAAALKDSGIFAKHSSTILYNKWKKYIWNVTFNPLSAAMEASTGDILDQPNLRALAEKICAEVISVGEKLGYEFSSYFKENIFPNAEQARNHQTSMLQDRLNGKKMEIESLCGYVVRKSRELNMSVPTIETIYHILKYIESSDLKKTK